MAVTWATVAEFKDFQDDAGISYTGVSDIMLQMMLDAAKEDFEFRTGWEPFLATTQTRKYDGMESGLLDLEGGLLTLTSLKVGTTNDYAGDLQTEGRDFKLLPRNAPLRGRPYTMIEFAGYLRDSITGWVEIQGSWGRFATIPQVVYQAHLQQAARSRQIQSTGGSSISGTVSEVRQDDLTIKTTETSGSSTDETTAIGAWQKSWDALIACYKRLKVA